MAQVAPIDAIHAGDQLRARGTKNADGTEMTAEEVVSGSFRNVSGTITSIDSAGSTLVVKDLATKKQVTIHIAADTQMRQLPDRMATMLAAVLNGNSAGLPAGAAQAAGRQGPAASQAKVAARVERDVPAPGRRRVRPATDAQPRAGDSACRFEERRSGDGGCDRGRIGSHGDHIVGGS